MVLGKLPVPGRPTSLDKSRARAYCSYCLKGSGGAMVLGKLPVPGPPTIWITVGQVPTALTVGSALTVVAGGGCLDIFTLLYPFSPLSPSLWETARYRLKYCLKRPLNPKQPTNQILYLSSADQNLKRATTRNCKPPVKCINCTEDRPARGWSGGAMVLGKLPVPGVLLVWIRVGQGPTALTVSGGGRVVRWCWVNFQCRGVLQF